MDSEQVSVELSGGTTRAGEAERGFAGNEA